VHQLNFLRTEKALLLGPDRSPIPITTASSMVHDPRVTTLLARLGGLYRDPSRVDRDAASLLKSSVGIHLIPGIAALVENDGNTCHCLVLQGTIAIVFRGNTYQLLVDIYLPPGYPIRPPVSYVRLTENMYLKENHPHVGSDGMVYMHYLHEWNPRDHTLIEMVVAMSSIFSADPPVFTRSTPPPPPPPPSSASTDSMPPPPAYSDAGFDSHIASHQQSAESERFRREQAEAILASEAEEANRVAEAARKAAEAEEENKRQVAAQKQWEEQKTDQIRNQVREKLRNHLLELSNQTRQHVESDWRDQHKLERAQETIAEEIDFLEKTKANLEEGISITDKKTMEIEKWLEDSKDLTKKEVPVDDLCQPSSKLHSQMLELSTENAALTDALYFLDRGFYMGQMDCTTHLKSVRKLAKRQFLVRAHLMKIDQAMLTNGHSHNHNR
jgi:ESCRT-I complex subunit TSG101